MIRRSTGCYVLRAHPQCVDVDILKIAAGEDDRLETAVRSQSSATDAMDRHEVLRGASVGIILILVRHGASFFTATFCLVETLLQSWKH
jgi:hypothetical protein